MGQHVAADDRSERQGQEVAGRPDAHGARPLGLREQDRHHGEGHDDERRPGHAENRSGGDERGRGGGIRAGDRHDAEDDESAQENGLPAVAVAQQTRGQHGGGERESIRGDEPLQLGFGSVQRCRECRQGKVQDRLVQADAHQGQRDCPHCQPTMRDSARGASDFELRHGSHRLSGLSLMW